MTGVVSVWISVVVLGLLCAWSDSCSPPEGPLPPDTPERRVYYADVVAYGRVIQHYSNNDPSPNSFTAEMEIFCVFKAGPIVPQYLNVSGAGFTAGLCFGTKMELGKSYVVFLRANGDGYTPSDTDHEVTGVNDPYLQNVTRVCDLFTQYPIGVTVATAVQCPDTDQTPNCVRHVEVPFTGTPPVGHTEIFPPSESETPSTTEDIPPLKEIPGQEVKVDAQPTKEGQGNGAEPTRQQALMVFTILASILAFLR